MYNECVRINIIHTRNIVYIHFIDNGAKKLIIFTTTICFAADDVAFLTLLHLICDWEKAQKQQQDYLHDDDVIIIPCTTDTTTTIHMSSSRIRDKYLMNTLRCIQNVYDCHSYNNFF